MKVKGAKCQIVLLYRYELIKINIAGLCGAPADCRSAQSETGRWSTSWPSFNANKQLLGHPPQRTTASGGQWRPVFPGRTRTRDRRGSKRV